MIVSIVCAALCVATMPLTWRLCFPPFPRFRAAAPIADTVPLVTFDYGGLV